MTFTKAELWDRFKKCYVEFPSLGLALDYSRVNLADDFFAQMESKIRKAFADMAALEKGAIANPDEKRMVGHYWLRNPALAPTPEIRREIEETLAEIKKFTAQVHEGKIQGARGAFKNVLLIGIGGSALGPQFVSSALGHPVSDKMDIFFFDNTDPDGFDKTLARIVNQLGETLCIVISKSGGTKETRNGMLEAKAAYEKAGLDFGKHTVAITQTGSELYNFAKSGGWIRTFPMWDWVGGRTSELSAVGLLPAALQGIDIDQMLAGAKVCDEATRKNIVKDNPAALLSLLWFNIGNGKGEKDMVVIPYKDRLELISRYLQQLIMESIGKELDLNGQVVNQGLAVYGNKGSTDQHAYVQQLREGVHNFFVTFLEVLKDRANHSMTVEKDATSGDYLSGFFLGTREALFDKNRASVTITISEVSPFSVGLLLALFERAVGFYASLVNINAYHQPGVQAGKLAADAILVLQAKIVDFLQRNLKGSFTLDQIASGTGQSDAHEMIFKICEHLAANSDRHVRKVRGASPFDSKYFME